MSNAQSSDEGVRPGRSHPLGPSVQPGGVNFSVYSKGAQEVELLLFDAAEDPQPSRAIQLDPHQHRAVSHYWNVFVPGLKAGQIYAYRADGPFAPHLGLRFDRNKVLLDPYGHGVAVPRTYDREAAARPGDNAAVAMKSVVADPDRYDWEGDEPPRRPFSRTVIYELHVGGFTRHPNSGVDPARRGTYAGLIDKIPYLVDLGITAVELLPVFQFDAQSAPEGRINYWGYDPVSFFAPHSGYASSPDPLAALDEFRDMVKALHRAGIEVILDVVYNHTAEGNHLGPTLCFKGLDNRAYYAQSTDRTYYQNYSGTGNALDASHSVVRRLIVDSLRYWVQQMHVDGFRFDLASVLARDEAGRALPKPPVLWDIETDPVLSGTKLIAEAWDAAGLYQVGTFFGDHWKEWNGHFRDDVRAFVKGEPGYAGKLASRILASPDLYAHVGQPPHRSINFVTCHDGFTLNDVVTYERKNNWANGEDNRDGHNDNLSWNCGVDGPTADPEVESLRLRQIKNFFAINLLSLGVPMLSMGDEVRRTQGGNNNAYCQDNEISWFDWGLVDRHAGLRRFVRHLVRFRTQRPLRERTSLVDVLREAPHQWHGVRLGEPDWSPQSRTVAFTVHAPDGWFHVIFNAYWEPLTFELPAPPPNSAGGWTRMLDTSLESPADICVADEAPPVEGQVYDAAPRSVVLLVAVTDR